MKREVRLPLTAAGRLDRALASALGVGRAAVKNAFAVGEVRIRGRRVRASDPATPGALVELELAVAGPPEPEAEPLSILAESPRWLVVDKPAGVATHPLVQGETGALANWVAARHLECADASPDPREGGAVHRLDVETSGCVLFARDEGAWDHLREQFSARTVEKVYTALVIGRMSSGGVCSVPLAQRGGRVHAVVEGDLERKRQGAPRPAETHYAIVEKLAGHTLLEIRIVTGVMHQIRAHLAHLGYPVLGDALYGGEASALAGMQRHFLHAAHLGFQPPEGGERVRATSPLPADLERLLATLRKKG